MKIKTAQFMCSVYLPADVPTDRRPEVILLGRSNVGKSSVINSLMNRASLARTSSTPGRTQSINFYLIDDRFYMVDLPGYGYAKVPEARRKSWKKLVESYLVDRTQIVLGLLVIDARHRPAPLDMQMRDWLLYAAIPHVVVLTKADKLAHGQRVQSAVRARGTFPRVEVIPFSAVTRLGVAELWRTIRPRVTQLTHSVN